MEELKDMLNDEIAAGLGLRLLNRDVLNDSSLMELTSDVVDFVHTMLQKGKKSIVQKFLTDHKDHLTPDMKDMISSELKSLNPGKI